MRDLINFCHTIRSLRGRRSVNDFAKEARVSPHTILALENTRKLQQALLQVSERRCAALARSIVQIALAAGDEPEECLGAFVKLSQGKMTNGDLHHLISQGRRRLGKEQSSPPPPAQHADTLHWLLHEAARATGKKEYHLPAGILWDETYYQPRDRGYCKELHSSFIQVLAERLRFPPIHVVFEERQVSNFETMKKGLRQTDTFDRLRLVAGVSATPSRQDRWQLRFLPIPGLRFHLACLARAQPPRLSWEDVIRAPQRRDLTVRALALAEEVGATFLEDERGFVIDRNLFLVRGKLDFPAVAARFQEMLAQDEKTGTHSVLVAGMDWAMRIAESLQGEKLFDLAAVPGADVPCYPESLAVHAVDRSWQEYLQAEIAKMFLDPDMAKRLAAMYASWVTAAAADYSAWLQIVEHPIKFPAFLMLSDFEVPLSEAFRTELEAALQAKLNRSDILRALAPLQGQAAPVRVREEQEHKELQLLLDQILPWKQRAADRLRKLWGEIGEQRLQQLLQGEIAQRPAPLTTTPDDRARE